jgi:membrane protease YdiL (CAAX protease family)
MGTRRKPGSAHDDSLGAGFPWIFFLVVFALSVPLWVLGSLTSVQLLPGLPISALMVVSTAVAACLFAWRMRGPGGVQDLLLRTFDFRRITSRIWYAPILLLMPAALAATYGIMRITRMPLPAPEIPWAAAPILFAVFFVAAAGEELAWSGTVLEPLQARSSALEAALVIGLVGAGWHAIPFVQGGNAAEWIIGQSLFTLAFRIVIVWLYNNTGRSVFATVVCHATYNLGWQMFPNRGSGYDPWVAAAVMTLIAVVVVLVWGATSLTGRESNITQLS